MHLEYNSLKGRELHKKSRKKSLLRDVLGICRVCILAWHIHSNYRCPITIKMKEPIRNRGSARQTVKSKVDDFSR